MLENNKPVLIYSTFPDAISAGQAGHALLNDALCACVNILPGMTSIYRWQGKIETAAEVVMIVKTMPGLAAAACKEIAARHPYEVPALLVLPVEGGAETYLNWIRDNTRSDHM